MSPVLFFYVVDALKNANGILAFLFVAIIIGFVIYVIAKWFTTFDDDYSSIKNSINYLKLPIIVLSVLLVLIPSEKTMYLMAGSHVLTEIASNDRVKSIAGSSLEIIEKKIKEYSEEEAKDSN